MRKSAILVLLLVLGGNLAAWWLLNRPYEAPAWQGIIRGVAYSPYGANQDPRVDQPTREQIEQDVRMLQGRVAGIRTYSSLDGQEMIPTIARKYGLRVTAGAWIDGRTDHNAEEIASLIDLARHNRNVNRVLVGNESLLRNDLPVWRLIDYIREVKESVRAPVSTAEPRSVWMDNPRLVEAVDFITVHILPYWEFQSVDEAIRFAVDEYTKLQMRYPDKPIVIGEIGWPSDGRVRGPSVPSAENQAKFIREWLNVARQRNIDFFIMEAFDQPFKHSIEGRVGAYWGIFSADRQPKFALSGPVEPSSRWLAMALLSTVLAAGPIALFLARFRHLRPTGHAVFATMIQVCVSSLFWMLWIGLGQYQTWSSLVIWSLTFLAMILLIAIVLTEGFELVEMLWIGKWKRRFPPLPPGAATRFPKVSLHLAICNEPPQMVIETLNSLAKLDYPNLEVLVIDNNTMDEAAWRPVETHCAALGEKFRFFHLGKWPGFKAGALNFALKQTAPDAEIVGVVDSDYVVRPDWLRAVVPYFERPEIGFVQSPQDHRDWGGNPFKEMINWEYAGFFRIGMVHRNERDAIIEHGTMTLVRKRAMDQVGHWSEWCICEDAEMGLRLMEAGWQSAYCTEVFGRGLVPDSFAGYKRQRHRWAYGAVQIVKRYWRWMMPFTGSRLTWGQRYHFLAGWVPWFADALNMVLLAAALVWTLPPIAVAATAAVLNSTWLLMLLNTPWIAGALSQHFPDLALAVSGAGLAEAARSVEKMAERFEYPLVLFVVPTIVVFAFKTVRFLMLYAKRVECDTWQRLGAGIAGLSLTYTIGRAVMQGFLTRRSQPFLRTPKCENAPALIQGIKMASHETVLFVVPLAAAIAVLVLQGQVFPDARAWAVMLIVQCVPYGAALLQSMIAAAPSFAWVRRALAPVRTETGATTAD
jgi:cellulose synthase/poly-beta-1,6-N-acetylglucosamine synthase-like glycosyltransferase/exo-beta-1,3-glucanase (GH17 family)